MHNVIQWMKKSASDFFSLKTLKKRVPITQWLPNYKLDLFIQDIIAGISVGLTAIPQGIAYAGVAGLPLEYGLYSGFMGCFVYLFLGSCKDLTIGPTAIIALMTQKYVKGLGADFAVLLTFLCGVIVFLFGVFNLGFLIEFISMPVTTGFTTAAAITIGCTQLHSLLGFQGRSDTFLDVWINLVEYANTIRLWDSVLGIVTIIILLLLRKLKDWSSRTSRPEFSTCKNLIYKFNWFISLARNAIVVILGCLLAWILKNNGYEPFHLTGDIGKGLPTFQPPPFSTTVNGTTFSFGEMVQELNSSILTIALISILEAVAIAKAFANGKMVDATQEMLALGACNIIGSFFRSMPTTGSFTRTAVNNNSGVQTTAGGIFTGALVLMALGFLTSTFYYIPKPVLAGLIISAMIFMVEYEVVILLWKTRKVELLPFFVTLICCLFIGLEVGIVIGIVFNILMILATTARPKIDIDTLKVRNQDVIMVTPTSNLVYCSADHFSRSVMSVLFSEEQNCNAIVVIDGSKIKRIDVTVAKNLKVLIDIVKVRNQKIFLWLFSPSTKSVCLGVYPKISPLFVDCQTLEEVIKYLDSEALVAIDTNL
ncbi:sodium-independent sulfate anion transporter-like isoform X2 [Arctopsyche grandis]